MTINSLKKSYFSFKNFAVSTALCLLTVLTMAVSFIVVPQKAHALEEGRAFAGAGLGFLIWTQDTGAGFVFSGNGGFMATRNVGFGLNLDYSRLGGVGLKLFNYGGFLVLQDDGRNFLGKVFLGGMTIFDEGASRDSGISKSTTVLAPGIGVAIPIELNADVTLLPELDYKVALLSSSAVHLVQGTVQLVFGF